ncbi:hypothetical protein BC829DRAFT_265321 [Chytridium lagenaria]|nr:hypothetical protein BC829DRAFT_265321 [Chytridium lagenaria]
MHPIHVFMDLPHFSTFLFSVLYFSILSLSRKCIFRLPFLHDDLFTNLTSTRSIARTQFNIRSYVYGRSAKTVFPASTTAFHALSSSILSNAYSAALSLSRSSYPSRAWASRGYALMPAMNVFAPDAPVDGATVPLNMVKPVNADGILEGMLYGDWPMNVWKAAAVRMAGGKSGSGSLKAGFGFVVAGEAISVFVYFVASLPL